MFNPLASLFNIFNKNKSSNKPEKRYIRWDDVHSHTEILYEKINKITNENNIELNSIVAIGTGGWIPGRIIKTCFDDKLPIETATFESYTNDNNQKNIQKKQWLTEKFIDENVTNKNVLVIDELNDTGVTINYCIEELKKYSPNKIVVGVVDHKEKEKKVELPTDVLYCYGRTVDDVWRVYPWESKHIYIHNMGSK